MDHVPPFDQISVNPPGPWQNANPDLGIEGSIPNAVLFEAVQSEILNVQDESGQPRNGADYTQLLQAIRSGGLNAFVDTGTADAMIVSPRTAYTTLALGAELTILKGSSPNATTTPTLKVNNLTRQVVKEDGTPLAVGDLPGVCLFTVKSDGSALRVVGLRKSDTASAAAIHTGTDTSASAGTITAVVSPAVTSYAVDHTYVIKVANACAGATVANLNGVGTRSVKRCDGSSLEATDWAAGDVLLLADDGTNLRLVGLTKLQAGELASTSTSVTNIIAKNSDAGLTSLTAFTANNVGVSDVAQVPNFTLIQSTGFFHGATAIRVNGSGAIRNNTSANGTAGATLRWGLYDASTSSVVAYAPYLGGGVPITGAQVAYTVPEHVFQGLNPAHSYCIQMLAQKGTSDGAELAFDTSIDALHNGANS